MAPRSNRRNGWHQVNGKWTRSLGERGCRVRLFQKRRKGVFYRDVWIPGEGYDRTSLRTRDRDRAERLGRELLANLMTGEVTEAAGVVALGQLWERYHRECAAYLDNKVRTQQDYAARASVLIGSRLKTKMAFSLVMDTMTSALPSPVTSPCARRKGPKPVVATGMNRSRVPLVD